MSDRPEHEPVLVAEVLETMAIRPGMTVLDATIGLAGHAVAILERLAGSGRVIGLDRDPEAVAEARARTARYGDQATVLHRSFAELAEVAADLAPDGFDAILLDLGVSRHQLTSDRFSFRAEALLDGRLDPTGGETVADLVNRLSEAELTSVLTEYGEERHARRIARGVVAARRTGRIDTAGQLVAIVKAAYPPAQRHGRMHVATRTFQALRIACNRMMEALDQALVDGPRALRPGGRMGVIAFHSLEDRRVKLAFRALAATDRYQLITRKPLFAATEEAARNPGARSARLRVLAATAVEEV